MIRLFRLRRLCRLSDRLLLAGAHAQSANLRVAMSVRSQALLRIAEPFVKDARGSVAHHQD
jgi:hypothetical protein